MRFFLKSVACRRYCQSTAKNCGVFFHEKLSGKDAGIYVYHLNRPETKNAIGSALLNGLQHAIDVVSADSTSRVVLLKSSVPGCFCSGADLKERSSLNEHETVHFVRRTRNLFADLSNLPVPVIAAIDGIALGGGLEIALACDVRIASSNVKLGLVETSLAIIPGAGGTQRLPRLIGPALAKEMMFTARIIDALDAFKLGLLNHMTEQNSSGDAAFQKSLLLAREILSKGPVAVRMVKQAVNEGMQVDLKTGLTVEDNCYAKIIPTKDRLEGLQAFKEKRRPTFVGE